MFLSPNAIWPRVGLQKIILYAVRCLPLWSSFILLVRAYGVKLLLTAEKLYSYLRSYYFFRSLFILTVTRRGICEDLFLTHTGSGTAIDPKDDLETRIITVLDQIQNPRQRQNACSARAVALLYIDVVPFQSALHYMARYCHHLVHPRSVTLQSKINKNSFKKYTPSNFWT